MCSSFPIYLCLWFLLVTASQILLPYWKLEISKLSLLHPLWSWKCKGLLHLLSPIVMWQSLCFLQWTKKLQIQLYDTGTKKNTNWNIKSSHSLWGKGCTSCCVDWRSQGLFLQQQGTHEWIWFPPKWRRNFPCQFHSSLPHHALHPWSIYLNIGQHTRAGIQTMICAVCEELHQLLNYTLWSFVYCSP